VGELSLTKNSLMAEKLIPIGNILLQLFRTSSKEIKLFS
jgi:hypothetical protein